MALARLALRNLQQKVNGSNYSLITKYWSSNISSNELVARFATAAAGGGDNGISEGTPAAVSRDLFFPSDLGNKLMQLTEQVVNRFIDQRSVTSGHIKGKVWRDSAKVLDTQLELKDGVYIVTMTIQVKITFDEDDNENWSSSSSGYGSDYDKTNTIMVLSKDTCKIEDINGEMKDGVLVITKTCKMRICE